MGKREKRISKKKVLLIYFTTFVVVFLLMFYWSTPKVAEKHDDTSLSNKDTNRLVSLHTMAWKIIGLSPQVSEELNGFVASVNQKLALQSEAEYSQFQADKGLEKRRSDSAKQFESSHTDRFKSIGLSEAAQYELMNILNTVWRIRYDPNAFTDPNWDKHYADKLKILFGDSPPPPCCSEAMYRHTGLWKSS